MMQKLSVLMFIIFLSVSCNTEHEVKLAPIEIKPIHITIDINIKVDKALDDFFGDIDAIEDELNKKEN